MLSFQKNGNIYRTPYNNWRITGLTNGGNEVSLPDGILYDFDTNGVLTSIRDQWNNTVTLTYTNISSTNLLTRVQHGNGLYLDFSYTNSLLARISSPSTNLSVSFSYNAQGELTNAARTVGGISLPRSYGYDSSSNYWNHSLTQHVNAAGDLFYYGYATNSSGYMTSTGITMVLGTNYYEHDLQYPTSTTYVTTLTYVRGNTNQVYQYTFDPYMHLVMQIAGPNGSDPQSTYGYDEGGNMLTENAINNATGESTLYNRTYDDWHNLTNQTFGYGGAAPANPWTYAWDTNWQVMTSITDPEGHRTEMEYTNSSVSRVKRFHDASNSYDTTVCSNRP